MVLKIFLAPSRELPPPSQKTESSPSPSLVPDLPPWASQPSGTSSAPPHSLPWGMWKPLPAAKLLHPPLLVSCPSAAHTSDSQRQLTLCGAASRAAGRQQWRGQSSCLPRRPGTQAGTAVCMIYEAYCSFVSL